MRKISFRTYANSLQAIKEHSGGGCVCGPLLPVCLIRVVMNCEYITNANCNPGYYHSMTNDSSDRKVAKSLSSMRYIINDRWKMMDWMLVCF